MIEYIEIIIIVAYFIGAFITAYVKYPTEEDFKTFGDTEFVCWITKFLLWVIYVPYKVLTKAYSFISALIILKEGVE